MPAHAAPARQRRNQPTALRTNNSSLGEKRHEEDLQTAITQNHARHRAHGHRSGLLSPVTMGAPGDLDPGFGNMGRVTSALQFDGPAWSVQPLSGDDSLFGGGFYYDSYYYGAYDSGYIGELSSTGAPDSQFSGAALNSMEVRDFALQPDGKIVAVGREILSGSNVFTVMRLQPDGSLDTSFATQGVLQQPATTGAQAVSLDPGGAIAVAGASGWKTAGNSPAGQWQAGSHPSATPASSRGRAMTLSPPISCAPRPGATGSAPTTPIPPGNVV